MTTAPSMQPPETEPTISPCSLIPSWLPTGRGEEPQVLTTVASGALARRAARPQLLQDLILLAHGCLRCPLSA